MMAGLSAAGLSSASASAPGHGGFGTVGGNSISDTGAGGSVGLGTIPPCDFLSGFPSGVFRLGVSQYLGLLPAHGFIGYIHRRSHFRPVPAPCCKGRRALSRHGCFCLLRHRAIS